MDLAQAIITVAPQIGPWMAGVTGTAVARKAIARVLTGGLDFAMSPLDKYVQAQRDEREANSLIHRTVADAAAKSLAADAGLVERAIHTSVSEAIRKQKAREGVAYEAAKCLSEGEKLSGGTAEDTRETIDEAWMGAFLGYAERAATETMQAMWGKILAGEVRREGAFSMASLRVISEINQKTAEAFSKAVALSVGRAISLSAPELSSVDLLACEGAGLLVGVSGLSLLNLIDGDGVKYILGETSGAALISDEFRPWLQGAAYLTTVGGELKKLLDRPDERPELRRMTRIALAEAGVREAWIGAYDGVRLKREEHISL